MPTIHERRENFEIEILCSHCELKTTTTHYWEVDGDFVCDECFDTQYSHMVKCAIDNCEEYDDENNFTDGMCASCLEVNTPLDPEVQEGWEHNIEKWNDE